MKTKKARTGNLLGWELSRQPTLAEPSHVAPPAAYLLEAAPGKSFPRLVRFVYLRPRALFFRRPLGARLGSVHYCLVSGQTPGRQRLGPAQTPHRVLQG